MEKSSLTIICWSVCLSSICPCRQDGTKVLTASCDKTCKLWDLQSNQAIDIAQVHTPPFSLSLSGWLSSLPPPPTHTQHAAPIKSVHWIQAPNYSCAITGSWDKTLKVNSSSSWLIPKLILLFPFSSLLSSFSLSSLSQLWDTRTPNPVLTLTLPERCYDMDVVRS